MSEAEVVAECVRWAWDDLLMPAHVAEKLGDWCEENDRPDQARCLRDRSRAYWLSWSGPHGWRLIPLAPEIVDLHSRCLQLDFEV